MFERFTERARQVVVRAQEEARGLNHDYIGTEHLLLGLLREEEGVAAHVLSTLGVTVERVRRQVVRVVGAGEKPRSGQIPFTPRAKDVLVKAQEESRRLHHSYIGTEHLLLGLLRQDDGVGLRILRDSDVDVLDLRDEVIVRAGGDYVPHGDEDTSSGPGPEIDPGWLDGLPVLLKPLGEEIRTIRGRAPDLGDLLLALFCVPHTPAAEALAELGIDIDALWASVQHARVRAQTDRQEFVTRLTELVAAKELAIEQGRFEDAAQVRDQQRQLRAQAGADQRARMAAIVELRRRLGISPPTAER
jgi:Clp amino terminal domain, pathogenicity island component/UvrB/uvrC motif